MSNASAASRPPTVAFFAANPTSMVQLDLEGELRGIEAELDAVGLRGMLRFVHRPAATPTTLQRALLHAEPTIVQFSGHGQGRAAGHDDAGPFGPTGIMLQDGNEEAVIKVVTGEALGDLFSKACTGIRLVFLNACYSDQQAAALLEHVDFVVGVHGEISDSAAKAFAVAFYRALAFGRTIQTGFELAVNALLLEGLEHDSKLPVLRHRESADPKTATVVPAPKAHDGVTWDVFLSYAHADRETVHPLAAELHDRHLRVFLDEWEIGVADHVQGRLEAGVRGSSHGLLAISPNTMGRPWVREEYYALLDKAVTQGKLLIPVLIGDPGANAELPPFLGTRRYVDLRGKTGDEYRQEIESIVRALRGQRPGPPPRRV